jgi:hypothetical protein
LAHLAAALAATTLLVSAPAAQAAGAHPVVDGTSLADTFVIVATGPDTATISVNGIPSPDPGPIDSVTVNGLAGNDTLRIINPDGGLFAPPGGIDYDGGLQDGDPGDSLVVEGGSADSGSYSAGALPSSGTITKARDGLTQTIRYTGLEPVVDTGAATNFTITATSADESIGLDNGTTGADGLIRVTGSDFESIEFSNKTNVTINGGLGDDTFTPNVTDTATGLSTLTVNTGSEAGDTIDFTGPLTQPGVHLTLNSAGDIRDDQSSTADVTSADLVATASSGIGVAGATDTLEIDTPTVEASSTTSGIRLLDSQAMTIGGLTPSVTGIDAGTSGDVFLKTGAGSITLTDEDGAASVRAGSTAGGVDISAASGFSSTATTPAVLAPAGTVSISADLDIALGASGSDRDNDVRADGSVSLTANRDVLIDGSSSVASDDFGNSTGAGAAVTAGRDAQVTSAHGNGAGLAANGTGDVDISAASGLLVLGAPGIDAVHSAAGNVGVVADKASIFGQSGVSAASGRVTLSTAAGHDIDLGSGTDAAASTLELANFELDRVSAPVVQIGDAAIGSINVSAPISPSNTSTLSLNAGGNITQVATLAVPSLQASAGGAVVLTNSGNDVVTAAGASLNSFSLANSGGLSLGTVDGVDGVTTADGDATVVAGGSLSLNRGVVAGGTHRITLAGNTTTQGAGSNAAVAADSLLLSGAGPYTLTNTSNDVTTMAANVTDAVTYADSNALTVGTVGATSGVTAGGAASITATGTDTLLTNSGPIAASAVTLRADEQALQGGSIDVGTGNVVIEPDSVARDVHLGSAGDPSGSLQISDAEVDTITADLLTVGSDLSSAVTFTGSITLLNVVGLYALSGSEVDDGNVGTDITGTSFAAKAGDGIGIHGPSTSIDMDVANVEAWTSTSGIDMNNAGPVSIGGVLPDLNGLEVGMQGNISFSAGGSIALTDTDGAAAVTGPDSGGDVSLSATGANSDVSRTVDGPAITASSGSVSVDATQDIALGTSGTEFDNDVLADDGVLLAAGRDVLIDGNTDVASDAFAHDTGSTASASAGRDVRVDNGSGGQASFGAQGNGGGSVSVSTGPGGVLGLDSPSSSALFSQSGDVSVAADRIGISSSPSGIAVFDQSRHATFVPATPGRAFDLGGTFDAPGVVEFSDDEISRIQAVLIRIGDATSGDINVTSDISTIETSTLSLISGGSIAEPGGSIGIAELRTTSAGSTNLSGANDVDTVAGTVTGPSGAYSYTDSDDVTVGSVDFTDGVTTTDGDLSVTAGDYISVEKGTHAGGVGSRLTLNAASEALQGPGNDATLSAAETLLEGDGAFTLDNPGNVTGTLAADVGGPLAYSGANGGSGVAIGSVGGTPGITTSDSDVTVDVADNLTNASGVHAGSGDVALTATGSEKLLTNSSAVQGATASLTADRMALDAGNVCVGTGDAPVVSDPPTRPIDVGSGSDPAGALSLSDAELDTFHAGRVAVGDQSGVITVSAPVAPANAPRLDLSTATGFARTGSGSLGAPDLRLVDSASSGQTWLVDPASVSEAGSAIPYSGVADLYITSSDAGADSVGVKASATTSYHLDGRAPAASPGDALTYDAEGRTVSGATSPPDGSIESPGVKPVAFKSFEALTTANVGSGASPVVQPQPEPQPEPPPTPPPATPSATKCENTIRAATTGGPLNGTIFGDVMIGSGGVDVMHGRAGNDCLNGAGGADRLFGDDGRDRVNGGAGNDVVNGGGGADLSVRGGAGRDVVDGGSGNDNASGDAGDDRVNGGAGNDVLAGGAGNDRLTAGSGKNRLSGGAGNDTLNARNGRRDKLNCGTGDDVAVADDLDVVTACEHVRGR